jgi:microsomal dipeptidase-like Zn-dependent dipeptidase
MADPIRMTTAQMRTAAKLGAKMECVWLTNLTGPTSHLPSMRHWKKVTIDDYAKAIRAVGPEHFVLGSDLGQYLNPIPTDGMKAFLLELRQAGFTDREIELMARITPAGLLGMSTAGGTP